MSDTIIPRDDDGRKSWAENMFARFPLIAKDLGYKDDERDAFVNDLKMLIYTITAKQAVAEESRARVSYHNLMLNGTTDAATSLALPLDTQPEPPAVIVAPGILPRLNQNVARIKAHPFCNDAIKDQLRLKQTATAKANLTDAQPTFKATPNTGSKVTLDWTRGKYDGISIESQRNDETKWTFLDKDMKSPFIDTRPPITAGQSEARRYRIIYIFNDETTGNWSDTIAVNTIP
ncbi:MAG: hypothetical protein H7Z37_13525 [Pyrinomonadaceae bacterium]|nr:hypothetical protein [Pyrinomonadaceae bacterium]